MGWRKRLDNLLRAAGHCSKVLRDACHYRYRSPSRTVCMAIHRATPAQVALEDTQ